EVVPPSTEHNPLIDLVPPQGIKLTPRHYAYLKISEGCNHSCSFCIIPSMRGKLRSEEHTSELQSRENLVCRLLLEKKKKIIGKTRAKAGVVKGRKRVEAARPK